jgi:threonine-phosphate decarboxylase
MLHGHGGNVYMVARQFGWKPSELIDMSSNINTLGPPPGLMEFLKNRLDSITALPEVDSSETSNLYAKHMKIEPECVLAGNGTTQFIYSLPAALESKNSLILGPTYADYKDACLQNGVHVRPYVADEQADFRPHVDGLNRNLQEVDTAFICNPNNPTGNLIPFELLQHLCLTHPKVKFIIDESYLPFVKGAEKVSMMNSGLDNVIVLGSLSKIFKIPGLRIGFVITSRKTVKKIRHCLLPWSVNSLAQAAVHYLVLQHERISGFVRASQLFFDSQRQEFYKRLRRIPGIKPFPSDTPFVLIKLPAKITSEKIWNLFAQKKILVRDCSNFYGLSNRYIRISLKTPEANELATDKLREFIACTHVGDPKLAEKQVA